MNSRFLVLIIVERFYFTNIKRTKQGMFSSRLTKIKLLFEGGWMDKSGIYASLKSLIIGIQNVPP